MAKGSEFISAQPRSGEEALLLAFWEMLGKEVLGIAKEGIDAVAKLYEAAVRENIGLTDHSLDDLKEMGHPYSLQNLSRGGAAPAGLASAVGSAALHGSFQVHVQRIGRKGRVIRGSGGGPEVLIDALGIDFEAVKKDSVGAIVGIEETRAAHVRYVVLGTRYMIARDFFAGTLLEVIDQMFDTFERVTKFRRLRVDTSL